MRGMGHAFTSFHSLQLRLRGHATRPRENDGAEVDIADEFSRLSRAFGCEGDRDSHAGLWSTGFVYDDHSLLTGDFLARGLHLDLLCPAAAPIPFRQIFFCLQETLRRVATCEITELTIICEPRSVRAQVREGANPASFREANEPCQRATPPPIVRCSSILFSVLDGQRVEIASGAAQLASTQHDLSALAAPISSLWLHQVDQHLSTAQKVRVSAT